MKEAYDTKTNIICVMARCQEKQRHMSAKLQYVCIECGQENRELYRDFQGGIIRVCHCNNCNKVVDKYIEYDPVVIFLDAVLHKRQVYRHLLFNTHLKSHWKLLLILLLCDTYLKWVQHSRHSADEHQEEFILYAALEWNFYCMFFITLFEWVVFCLVMISLYAAMGKTQWNSKDIRVVDLVKALILSSFGKLLVIPALIWGQSHSVLYLALTYLFVFTSNAEALQVMCGMDKVRAGGLLLMSYLVQTGFEYLLLKYIVG